MSDPENTNASSSGPSQQPQGWLAWIGTRIAAVIGVGLAAIAGGAILAAIALAVAYPNLPDINGLIDYRPKLPLRVYSADGVLIGEFGEERRNFTPIAEIPKVMQQAVLAIEDARFYEHSGIDYKGILRASVANLGETRSQGGSTITMQVARNFYLSTEKTYTRKIYEILLAMKIENQLSKEQILELYMNQIFLGRRSYGFAAACETYFGKPLKQITVAEAAVLAGLPAAPSAYNPIVNPRRAQVRQRYIIERMFENGFITAQQRDDALAQKLVYKVNDELPVHAEYVAELARALVYAQYGDETYTRGLNVTTTIRAGEQEAAYRAVRRGIMDFERRQVYRGPEDHVDLPSDANQVDQRVAEALEDHPDDGELRSAVVFEASPKKVVAMLQTGDTVTMTGEGLRPAQSGLAERAAPKVKIVRGSIIRVMRTAKGDWTITQVPEVEGALVSVDPKGGEIHAMVGGFDYGKNKFNHVTQAWRQPGSSFKPFIYSAALEKGFSPSTVINDAPLFFDAGVTGSQPWEPKNYDGQFDGPMSMRRALAKSKNMVSIRILQNITPQYAQQWSTRFGFDPDKQPPYLTMALGAGSATPIQMARAYSVFANGGYLVDPVLITKVTDDRGRVINETTPHPLDDSMRVIDARNAFVMDSLLQEVARSGTAARAQAVLKRPDLFGKTGTTNDSLDAWFAGFQPSLVSVVWIGYDQPRKLGDRETGGGLALPVWIDYMSTALKGVPVTDIPAPPGVVNVGGDWFYQEYANGGGVTSLGLGDPMPAAQPDPEEKKSILDLFKGQ